MVYFVIGTRAVIHVLISAQYRLKLFVFTKFLPPFLSYFPLFLCFLLYFLICLLPDLSIYSIQNRPVLFRMEVVESDQTWL